MKFYQYLQLTVLRCNGKYAALKDNVQMIEIYEAHFGRLVILYLKHTRNVWYSRSE